MITTRKTKKFLNSEEKLQIIEDYKNNDSFKNLAKKYNVGKTTIWKILKNIPKHKQYNYLSLEQKFQIKDQYENTNIGLIELTNKYDTTQRTVLRILKNTPKKGHRITEIDEEYFKIINSSDKAYFIGFFTADAHIRVEQNRKSTQLRINAEDIEIIENFNKFSNSKYQITYKTIKNKSNSLSKTCGITLSNTIFTNNLINQGVIPEKSTILDFPKHIPDELMGPYIRGLIDGDGGWHYYNNSTKLCLFFCSPVKSFIEQFQLYLCNKLELKKLKIYNIPSNTCYSIKFCGDLKCLKLYKFLYEDDGPFLKRKHKRATLYFQNKGLIPITNQYCNDTTPYHTKPKMAGE